MLDAHAAIDLPDRGQRTPLRGRYLEHTAPLGRWRTLACAGAPICGIVVRAAMLAGRSSAALSASLSARRVPVAGSIPALESALWYCAPAAAGRQATHSMPDSIHRACESASSSWFFLDWTIGRNGRAAIHGSDSAPASRQTGQPNDRAAGCEGVARNRRVRNRCYVFSTRQRHRCTSRLGQRRRASPLVAIPTADGALRRRLHPHQVMRARLRGEPWWRR